MHFHSEQMVVYIFCCIQKRQNELYFLHHQRTGTIFIVSSGPMNMHMHIYKWTNQRWRYEMMMHSSLFFHIARLHRIQSNFVYREIGAVFLPTHNSHTNHSNGAMNLKPATNFPWIVISQKYEFNAWQNTHNAQHDEPHWNQHSHTIGGNCGKEEKGECDVCVYACQKETERSRIEANVGNECGKKTIQSRQHVVWKTKKEEFKASDPLQPKNNQDIKKCVVTCEHGMSGKMARRRQKKQNTQKA